MFLELIQDNKIFIKIVLLALLKMHYKGIMGQYLLMGKQELVRLLLWLVITKIPKLKELYRVLSIMLFKLFKQMKVENMLLEQVLFKYITKISWTYCKKKQRMVQLKKNSNKTQEKVFILKI
jgi:hypothetical protein